MSIRVMTLVWEIDLPASDKIVLLALADCANDEGKCWPGMASLTEKCSKGERTVQASIQRLVKAGHLTRQEVLGKGCNYTVHPRKSCAPAKPAPPQKLTKTPAKSAGKPSRTIKQPKEARAREIPVDWRPAQFGVGTKSRAIIDGWHPDEHDAHLEGFIAFHRSRGNKYPDWQAAWSTWTLNTVKFNRGSQSGNRPANDEITNPYAREVARRQAERSAAEFG